MTQHNTCGTGVPAGKAAPMLGVYLTLSGEAKPLRCHLFERPPAARRLRLRWAAQLTLDVTQQHRHYRQDQAHAQPEGGQTQAEEVYAHRRVEHGRDGERAGNEGRCGCRRQFCVAAQSP